MQDGTEFGALSVGTKTEQEDNSVSRSPCKAVLPFRPVPFRPVPTRPLAARSVGSLTLPPPPPAPRGQTCRGTRYPPTKVRVIRSVTQNAPPLSPKPGDYTLHYTHRLALHASPCITLITITPTPYTHARGCNTQCLPLHQ